MSQNNGNKIITEVKVYPAKENGRLKAYASVTLDFNEDSKGDFIVRDLKIIEGDKGLFVSMPSRRRKDGSFRDIVHPVNAETRKMLEDSIIKEYNKAVESGFSFGASEEE